MQSEKLLLCSSIRRGCYIAQDRQVYIETNISNPSPRRAQPQTIHHFRFFRQCSENRQCIIIEQWLTWHTCVIRLRHSLKDAVEQHTDRLSHHWHVAWRKFCFDTSYHFQYMIIALRVCYITIVRHIKLSYHMLSNFSGMGFYYWAVRNIRVPEEPSSEHLAKRAVVVTR